MEACDLLVAGAGPAGVAAAAEASRQGLRVILVEPRPKAGGQYYARPASGGPFAGLPDGLAAGIDPDRVAFWGRSEVWGSFDDLLAVTTPGGTRLVAARAVVVATGALERPQPFPGWDRPSVLTAGAAQLLLKEHGVILGGRVVVAGSGPFLVAVAAQLRQAGADVAALVEATPWPVLARRLVPVVASRMHGPEVLRFARLVRGVRRIFGARLERAVDGAVVLSTGERIECDALCVGHGFEPRLPLARLLGCATGDAGVGVDRDQRTSQRRVFAAGEATGIGGAALAAVEGRIAGLAVASDLIGDLAAADCARRRELDRQRARFRRASARLLGAYRPLHPLALANGETVVCRCEGVTLGAVRAAQSGAPAADGTRALKALLRCGMGPCQGAFCAQLLRGALATSGDLDASIDARVRPPIAPVRVSEVALLGELSPERRKSEELPG